MKRRSFVKTMAAGAAASTFGARPKKGKKPNIIVILSDDMGYSDLGCYGSEIHTPILDGLARNGLRFTQFYNTARCCPTRACILTGLYPHQAGIGHMMKDQGLPGYRGDLNNNCVTLAEAVKPAGYATYAVGKWHVTRFKDPEGPKHNWPLQRGFDRFYGTIHGAGSYFDPNSLTRDNTQISPYADPEYKPKTFYYTDAITDHAVRFIEENPRGKPFFMYVAYTAAHWPMHALPDDIAKYKGVYDKGYEAIREARFERMKKLGVIKPDTELSPAPGKWADVPNKAWEARCMEVYAAMIDRMDQGIGKIIETLKKHGLFENTLIMFMQDNGGCAEGMGRRGNQVRGDKPGEPMDPAELQRDMIPKKTRDGWPVLMGTKVMPGPADTYIAYGKNWANVSNTPFREYKHWVHEGGISTPLIVHWPAGIKAKNELRHQPSHLVDIMATCVDVAGARYPSEYKGHAITPKEGVSLVPAFDNRPIEREALFWEHEGNRAVRIGDWKLVAKGSIADRTRPVKWELYNIAEDRAELHDLSEKYPERVAAMAAKWESYAERCNVFPCPITKGKSAKKQRKKDGRKKKNNA